MGDALFSHHEGCPTCSSRDNLARYDDGSAYCFGCGHHEKAGSDIGARVATGRTRPKVALIRGEASNIPSRALNKETCQKFRYLITPAGEQAAGYTDEGGRVVAQKIRPKEKKGIRWVGDPSNAVRLFGWQCWRAGGKRIVVTEGELDALSMSQAMNNRWPVVSVAHGAQAAWKDLQNPFIYEYLESFSEIVLMFDMDEHGQEAAVKCAELFTMGKAKIAELPLKDASDMLTADRAQELRDAAWSAREFRPDGVVEGEDL